MKADRMKLTSIIYVWFFMGGRSYVKIAYSKFKPSGEIYGEILKVGVSMFLRQQVPMERMQSPQWVSCYGLLHWVSM